MKIAVFGGTFNPLHIGHAVMADTVIKELAYDCIIFVPAASAPHKIAGELSKNITAFDRFNMVQAFCNTRKDGAFIADPCEINRGGISYTIDTINYIYKNYSFDGKPGLVMGEENAAEFHKWKNAAEISELCDIIILKRKFDENTVNLESVKNSPSQNYCGDGKVVFSEKDFLYPHKICHNPLVTLSSTEIRERIVTGKSFTYLLPESVAQYIKGHNLYGKND